MVSAGTVIMNTSCAESLEAAPQLVRTFLATFCVVEAICASTLNALLLFLYCRFRNLLTTRNKFLFSLAIADCLIGLVAAPSQAALLIASMEDKQHCVAFLFNKYSKPLIAVTGLIVTSISLDRYFYVTRGRRYDLKLRSWKLGLFLAVPWIMPGLLTLAVATQKDLTIWTILGMNGCCVVALICCNSKLGRFLRNRRLPRSYNSVQPLQLNNITTTNKANRMILAISLTHILCTAPFLVFRVIFTASYYASQPIQWLVKYEHLLKVTVYIVFQINSCVNPVLYFGMSREFREAAKTLRAQIVCAVSRGTSRRGQRQISAVWRDG